MDGWPGIFTATAGPMILTQVSAFFPHLRCPQLPLGGPVRLLRRIASLALSTNHPAQHLCQSFRCLLPLWYHLPCLVKHAKLTLARQYAEFGRDIKYLAESLDILTSVVTQANSSLQRQAGYNAVARWDRTSLGQIIGDYHATLRECHELLRSNERYRTGGNPLRNIEWNVLVQPTADQLRQRISLHNSKVLHVLKPFEM